MARKKTKRRGTSKPRSLARALTAKEKSVRELGEGNVRARARIGSTRWLTPTKRGWGAFNNMLLAMQKASRKDTRAAWTFDLSVRYRGPDGKLVPPKHLTGAGFARLRDVRRERKRIEKKRGRKFRSEAEAFRYVGSTSVIAAVGRQIEGAKDLYRIKKRVKATKGRHKGEMITLTDTDVLMLEMRGKSAKQVQRAFRRFRETRSLSFKVTVNRVVTTRRKVPE